MPNQDTKELYKQVEIISVTPNDKFNLEGMKGNLILETVEVGKSMILTFGDNGLIRTSKIEEINKTDSEVEVKTRNSIYKLKIVKEEF